MSWWWRARAGTAMVLLAALAVPALLLAGLHVVTADLLQFLTLALPLTLAWSFTGRDDPREVYAQRPVRYADAALVLGVTTVAVGVTLAARAAVSGPSAVPSAFFLLWNLVFAAGLTSLLMRWLTPVNAASSTCLVSVTLYITRFVFTPATALIHRESPPAVACAVSAVLLLAGAVALALRRGR